MSSTGNCYDHVLRPWQCNAPMESFFRTLKTELVHHQGYASRTAAKSDIFFYIESFYNRSRLYSSLDYVSPAVFEELYHEQTVLTLCPQN